MIKLPFGPITTLGLDISDWQTPLNWAAARAAGVKFVTVKVSEGVNWAAKKDEDHISNARVAGMIIGHYHWFHFGASPVQQAAHFFRQANHAPNDLPPALDVEWSDGRQMVNDSDAVDVLVCLGEIEKLFGEAPIIYTSASFFYGMSDHLNQKFKRFTPWICDIVSPPNVVRTPEPWDRVAFRQHTFEYKLPGYAGGNLDADMFNGNEEQLKSFAENRDLPGIPQPPIEDPATLEEKKDLQRALNAVGVSPQLVEDGLIGAKSRAALRWAAESLS